MQLLWVASIYDIFKLMFALNVVTISVRLFCGLFKSSAIVKVMEVRKNKAERLGFEPRRPYGPHAFQACSLSQLGHLSVKKPSYTNRQDITTSPKNQAIFISQNPSKTLKQYCRALV